MGSSFLIQSSTKQPPKIEDDPPSFVLPLSMPIKQQLICIIIHWIREYDEIIADFPVDIMELIAESFVHQSVFESEHTAKLEPDTSFFSKLPRLHSNVASKGEPKPYYLYKIILVGDRQVGKTAIKLRYHHGRFVPEFELWTDYLEFIIKKLEIDGVKIKLQIWDIPKDQRHEQMRNSVRRRVHAVVMLYDVTNEDSFKNIQKESLKWSRDTLLMRVLVGNKIDLKEQRIIATEQGEKFAKESGIDIFMETSAKTGENIDELFAMITNCISNMSRRVERPWFG